MICYFYLTKMIVKDFKFLRTSSKIKIKSQVYKKQGRYTFLWHLIQGGGQEKIAEQMMKKSANARQTPTHPIFSIYCKKCPWTWHHPPHLVLHFALFSPCLPIPTPILHIYSTQKICYSKYRQRILFSSGFFSIFMSYT